MNTKPFAGILLVAALASSGCKGDKSASAESAPEPVVLGPENVTFGEQDEISRGPVISGTRTPELAAQVRAEVAGSVVDVVAGAGQQVRRGALLARIDDTALRDAFIGARAAARTAESNLQVQRRNAERAPRPAAAGPGSEPDPEQ